MVRQTWIVVGTMLAGLGTLAAIVQQPLGPLELDDH
jgi:hypothetical protein